MQSSAIRAIVTGAASGLGRATAQRLAQQGAKVAILDLSTSNGAEVAKELGGNCIFHPTDITSEDDVKSSLDAALSAFGKPINVAVNCAGVAPAVRVLHKKKGVHPLSIFEQTMKVNTVGSFNVLRLAAEAMSTNEVESADESRGVIINTASIAGYEGQIGQAAYAASKGAIIGMTLPIARDLAGQQIRVNTIAPGLFLTPLLVNLGEKVCDQLGQQITFPKRLGKPEDFAKLVEHIINNGYINGEVIRLDGAFRLP